MVTETNQTRQPISLTPSALDAIARKTTSAPLRMAGTFRFDASQDDVFRRVSDPSEVAKWFPLLRGGELDHATSCSVGTWGEGSKRTCYTNGMGTLFETIHHWDAPHVYAYEVRNFMMPLKDHLAVMAVRSTGASSCEFRWHQYYDLTGIAMRHAFPTIMLTLMNKGMVNLAAELGGAGGSMRHV